MGVGATRPVKASYLNDYEGSLLRLYAMPSVNKNALLCGQSVFLDLGD